MAMTEPDQLVIPVDLARAAKNEGRQGWLASLPVTIGRLETAWSICVGQPFQPGGRTAWVAPATRDGEDLVVKVLWRHPEAEHEADALRAWDGDGAVRLHADAQVDSKTIVLLLERCQPGTTLKGRPEAEQDIVVAGLLRRLWRQPPAAHRFRSLQSMCELGADEFEHKTADGRGCLDPGLAREGIALFRELPANAEREPWLVIDPKPYVGDPSYDALQHLLNCDVRLHTDPHRLLARMAELLDLHPDRLRLWLFARCVQESPDWPSLAEVARRLAPA